MPESERALPERASLEQQKKQAKDLLRAVRAGDAAALGRVRRHLPDKQRLTLADAQFVLAREYGCASWAELKRRIALPAEAPVDVPTEFRRAVAARDAARLRALLEHHGEARDLIDRPLFSFASPALAHVSSTEDGSLIDVLLEFGADPNRRTGWWAGGFHPLHDASAVAAERLIRAGAVVDACAAAHLDRIDLLRALLDEEPARVRERGGDGKTPLHFARTREVADLLLERGGDIEARDLDHRSTPAQWMLEQRRDAGRYELARHLVVERGAAADIFLAAALGLTERLRELLDADPSLLGLRTGQGEYGSRPPSSYHIYFWTIGQNRSPAQVAAQFEQPEALAVIRESSGLKQRFFDACAIGDADEARRLVRAHPDLPSRLEPHEHRALADAAWAADVGAVRLMLELGFDPAVRGHDGGSALHCAAWEGSAPCVEAILRHDRGRGLVHDRDPSYQATPMGWCCHGAVHCGSARADHAAVARLLLDAGAEPPEEAEDMPEAVRQAIRAHRR